MATESREAGKRRSRIPKLGEQSLTTAERDRQALELRKAGAQFSVIAARLGYANESGAYKAVQRGLKATLQEPADELRTLETQRLDRMLMAVWQDAISGDVKAVDRVLRIIEQRARLLGLNAAPNNDLGLPAVDQWLRTLMGGAGGDQ